MKKEPEGSSAPNNSVEYPRVLITTDGACGPTNPGMMRIGVIFQGSEGPDKDASVIGAISRQVGWGTSNEAEYLAITAALDWAIAKGVSDCVIFTDSQLCERQINGGYDVKASKLKGLCRAVHEKMPQCGAGVLWHPRNDGLGPIADALAKGGEASELVFRKLVTDSSQEEVLDV